jgi:hypothetical protein
MKLASFDCESIQWDDDTRFELGTCFSIAISNSKALFAGTGGSPVCISFV